MRLSPQSVYASLSLPQNLRTSRPSHFVKVLALGLSCLTVPFVQAASVAPAQPGSVALEKIAAQGVSDLQSAEALVEDLAASKRYGRMLNLLKQDYNDESGEILMMMSRGESLENATLKLAKKAGSETAMGHVVKSAFILFPLNQADLYHYLQQHLGIRDTLLNKWAENAGVLTEPTMPAPDDKGLFIQPLIESASISVFDVTADTRAELLYRRSGAEQWQQARDLSFEPVNGILTGPVVYLEAGTAYDVKVVLHAPQQPVREIESRFTTRADKPVIDPDKVYKLSDIYKGGMLDLEALGIEGSKDGYAKIVGDAGTVITPDDSDKYAIFTGDNSYIYFENITIEGARVHAIYGEKGHDIWINQCDISGWGRAPNVMKKGIAYEMEDAGPINYDSAIYFRQSGVITVENCHVHDPRAIANDWSYGHPKGPNAFLAHANHPDPQFKGQVIVRNNHFTGTADHRLNDVIEGRKNAEPLGGFVRDSAIYNNVLAYSNDDAIEVDGGQQNVLVYNNDISHTYSGISITPVRVGPGFVFNNYIHDLGDLRGKQWASIKMGGLLTSPLGQSIILHNLITTKRNGLTASRFKDDNTFWTQVQNNVVINQKDANRSGFAVFDPQGYPGSEYINNYFYNLSAGKPKIQANITVPYEFDEAKLNQQIAEALFIKGKTVLLPNSDKYRINNFTRLNEDGTQAIYGIIE